MNTAAPPAAPAPLSDNPIVLLVDDQLIIGEAVRRILAVDPRIVFHFCQKGAEALATAARTKPTVILQDLVMPDADGLDLVRGYRQQEATTLTPLIVLSSKEEGSTKAEAFARGANDYIVKLPDPVELIARIRYHSRGYLSLLQRNEAFEALHKSQAALAAELAKAATYVRSLLPAPLAGPVSIDWRFVPSASLGGDCFDYFWIDDDHLAIYLLDVCGHGVGPALLGVSAMNAVRSGVIGGVNARDPSAVLGRLNAAFPMEHHHNMFFTIWYGVYQRSTRRLAYSGGGHPPPLLMAGPRSPLHELEGPGLPIGVMSDSDFPTLSVEASAGSSLLLYSDGVTEVFTAPGELWGTRGLIGFVRGNDPADPSYLDRLHATVMSIAQRDVLGDDFSTVLVRFP
ncbi:MAG: SpoIIE family protein phosphatase [Phycisphaerales bacterium]|nr:SpoIIE family protein phosphatase [Phycisphaerales bacterium]